MKNLQLTLVLVTFFTLSSCLNNETEINISDDDLIGTWNLTEFKSENGNIIVTENTITETIEYGFEGFNFDATITFEDDPRIVTGNGSLSISYTAYFQGQIQTGQEIIDSNNTPNGIMEANWSLDDGVLTFSLQGEEMHAEIIEFDDSTLRLKMVLDQNLNYSNIIGGSISGNFYITLSK